MAPVGVGSVFAAAHIGPHAAVHIAGGGGVYKPMDGSTTDALREALRAIKDPATGRDLAAAGLIDSIEARDGLVHVALRTTRGAIPGRRLREARICQSSEVRRGRFGRRMIQKVSPTAKTKVGLSSSGLKT